MSVTSYWLRDQAAAYLRAADRLDVRPARRGETMGVNCAPSADAMARAARLGVRWVRWSIEAHWQTRDTAAWDWSRYDRAIACAHALGLRVIQVCQGMPAPWSATGEAGHYAPKGCEAMLAWSRWAAECAMRGADCIEIGNEWNHSVFWADPDPASSATLTAFAADAVKQASPSTVVVTGGLSPAAGDLAPAAFLAAQLAAVPSMLDHVDGVGHHPYEFPGDPRNPDPRNAVGQTATIARAAGLPVWATEWGSTVGPVGDPKAQTEDDQLLHTTRYFDAFDQLEAGGVVWGCQVWYCLDDRPDKAGEWSSWMGLYRADGSLRPAAELIARRAGESR